VRSNLLSSKEVAQRLGISTATLYDWLAKSNSGSLIIRGRDVTIDYFQGGPRGQGRIKLEVQEVQRLKELMRVRPRVVPKRRPAVKQYHYPGITVKLGNVGG